METLRFTISGAALTNQVRQLVLSGRSDGALKALVEDIEGMTYDAAVAILRGEKALVDREGGIYLGDEDPDVRADWEQELRERYGHVCQIRKEWYRPCALVMDFGPRDVPAGGFQRREGERVAHYVEEGEIAVVPAGGRETVVCVNREVLKGAPRQALGYIFERVDPVPFWAQKYVSVSPTQAVMVFDAVRIWDMRGHSIWYPRDAVRDRLYPVSSVGVVSSSQKADYREKRKLIREQAGGWLKMVVGAGTAAEYEVQVPRAPFVCWSLWRTSGAHLMPKYTPVSEPGLRLTGDSAFHSDWMLGAFDRDLVEVYEDLEVREASYALQAEVQEEVLGFKAAVLSGRGCVSGKVVQPGEPGEELPAGSILVLPNARPEWESMVRQAVATIVPVGGELCHLAVVAGEVGKIIMRVPGCMDLYPEGTILWVDTEKGEVRISSQSVRGAFGPIGD